MQAFTPLTDCCQARYWISGYRKQGQNSAEWLEYGEDRRPSFYEGAKAGKLKLVSRDSTVNPAFLDET